EDEPDGEEHLRQLARAVEPRVKQALQYYASQGYGDKGEDERERERHPDAAERGGEDIAPGHGEHAVRQVDESHQAHRHRQADGDHVQDHAVSGAVEGDAYERGKKLRQGLTSSSAALSRDPSPRWRPSRARRWPAARRPCAP